jgi:hypothetical protein
MNRKGVATAISKADVRKDFAYNFISRFESVGAEKKDREGTERKGL